MAYQALILLAIAASASAQAYGSSSLSYGHAPRAPHAGSPFRSFSANSYSSLSSAPSLSLAPSSGTYAPSAPLLAQYPAQQGSPYYEPGLQQLLYSNRGYDVTEAPQEPEAPPAPIPPPSPPVVLPLPSQAPLLPQANQAPLPPPQQPPPPDYLAGILAAGSPQGGSHSSTSFSSPYVSYSH